MKLDAIAPGVAACEPLPESASRSHAGPRVRTPRCRKPGCRGHPCPRARWSGHRPGRRYPRARYLSRSEHPRSVFCDIHSPLRADARAAVVLGPGPQQAARSRPNGSERTCARGDAPSPRWVTRRRFRAKFTRSREARYGFRDAPAAPARARGRRAAGRGHPLARRRARRRHDAAGEAALEARSGRDRPARPPAAARRRPRLRDEREDDDERRWSPRSCARACGSRTTPRARTSSPGVASTLLHARRRRARPLRGRRGGPLRGRPPRRSREARAARQPLPRPARPLRRARDSSPPAGAMRSRRCPRRASS